MKLMKDKLPRRFSTLILHALKDLRKAERSPKYKVDMTNWHMPNSHCSVCFAGAVMAFSLKLDPKTEVDRIRGLKLQFKDTSLTKKFLALDRVRQGIFTGYESAAYHLTLPEEKVDKAVVGIRVPLYSKRNRNKFHQSVRLAAKRLKKVGL